MFTLSHEYLATSMQTGADCPGKEASITAYRSCHFVFSLDLPFHVLVDLVIVCVCVCVCDNVRWCVHEFIRKFSRVKESVCFFS